MGLVAIQCEMFWNFIAEATSKRKTLYL